MTGKRRSRLRAAGALAILAWLAMAGLLWHAQWLAAGLLAATGLALAGLAAFVGLSRPAGADDELTRLQARCGDRRFRVLLEGLSGVAVQGYDRHRRVVFWNQASTRLYGYRPEEALGQRLEALIVPEAMREAVIRRHRDWVGHGIPIPAERLRLRHRDGHPVEVYSYHVMLDGDTDQPVMFCVDVGLDVRPPSA
ncbi:PAS domain-containing protein [Halomonas koreensis]|uniref:PAS domain-containing protein n=1 Tax=Halomonas koreensis TaxID=245385 RepID=A0ABU1G223_9GAMM|nr:PAS domain-containing protein [Halomonas koreensis]MDR5866999.1 PAS domain-containing protein [Halomonas koreensis]